MFETGRGELIEAYLLDFDEDIYDEQLRVEFLKRLRGEKRFESVEALIEQMHRDVEDADPTRVLPLDQALAFLPRIELDDDASWRAAHGQSIPGESDAEHVLLADAEGPVAIAEPREDGLLKPVVGFRG